MMPFHVSLPGGSECVVSLRSPVVSSSLPGVIDDEGQVVRDLRSGFVEVETGLLENPSICT